MEKGCHGFRSFITLVARVCISAIFIIAGVTKIVQYHAMAGMLANMGMPSANWLLILAIVFELGGGLLVFFGWFARFGAFLLFVFVIVATFLFHSFWNFQGADAANQTYHFLKNLSILGGLLYVMACGADCFSLDGIRHRAKHQMPKE